MKIKQNTYLGVFDSGVGGLTVLSSLKSMLPQEQFLYVSDDANAPYGKKSKEEITSRSFNPTFKPFPKMSLRFLEFSS